MTHFLYALTTSNIDQF